VVAKYAGRSSLRYCNPAIFSLAFAPRNWKRPFLRLLRRFRHNLRVMLIQNQRSVKLCPLRTYAGKHGGGVIMVGKENRDG
jgi:hypothetical protein